MLEKLLDRIPVTVVLVRNRRYLDDICSALIGQVQYEPIDVKRRLQEVLLKQQLINLGVNFTARNSAGAISRPFDISLRTPATYFRQLSLNIIIPRRTGTICYLPQYPSQLYQAQDDISQLKRWLPSLQSYTSRS